MTVSSETKRSDYAGNGSTTAFATGFRFLENSHIKVILTVDSTGVETVQAETTNYTLTGAGLDAGGTVTMLVAPPSGNTLTIKRDIPLTQGTDYVENDAFPAESHEEALDKLTMITQQQQEELDRSLKLSESQTSNGLTVPVAETGKFLRWKSDGNLENTNLEGLGTLDVSDFAKTYLDDTDAATTRTTLDISYINLPDVTSSTFTGQSGKYVAVNGGETGLEFVNAPAAIDTFTGLTDTPANYTSSGGYTVKVNSGATALEFVEDEPDQLASAWVNFNGTGTVAIRDSYNVTSITDNGAGNYTVNFTNTLNDANYAVSGMCTTGGNGLILQVQSTSTSNVNVISTNAAIGSADNAIICVVVHGGN